MENSRCDVVVSLPSRYYMVIDSLKGRTFNEKLVSYIRYNTDVVPNIEEHLEALQVKLDRKKAALKYVEDYYRQYRDFMYRLSKIDVFLGSMVQDVERLLQVTDSVLLQSIPPSK